MRGLYYSDNQEFLFAPYVLMFYGLSNSMRGPQIVCWIVCIEFLHKTKEGADEECLFMIQLADRLINWYVSGDSAAIRA